MFGKGRNKTQMKGLLYSSLTTMLCSVILLFNKILDIPDWATTVAVILAVLGIFLGSYYNIRAIKELRAEKRRQDKNEE